MNVMINFALRMWDGWHMIAEGIGLRGIRADRFADVAWIGIVSLTAAWLVTVIILFR